MRPEILVEREKTHGSFKVNAALFAKLNAAGYQSGLNEGQRLALIMIYVKISRIISGNPTEPDHWLDIAGYAQLGAEACKGN